MRGRLAPVAAAETPYPDAPSRPRGPEIGTWGRHAARCCCGGVGSVFLGGRILTVCVQERAELMGDGWSAVWGCNLIDVQEGLR